MKLHDYFWDTPTLDPYRKKAKKGEFLFEQGFPASSFIILTTGIVELLTKKNDKLCVVNYLGAGNMLGEKVLTDKKIYSRIFGARAMGEVCYLELGRAEIKKLREESPQLFIDVLEAALRISNERINRMNQLIQNIRSAKPTERFLYLLAHFAANHGQPCPEGTAIVLNFNTVNYYLDINSFQMEEVVEHLIHSKLLIKKSESVFVVTNEKELQENLAKLSADVSPLDFV